MPRGGLGGGFDVGSALSDYENIINFMETMKQRRLKQENPLVGAMEAITGMQEHLGTQSLSDYPELIKQIEGRYEVPKGQVGEFAAKTRSRVQQKRMQDFQSHLSNMLQDIQTTKSANLSKIGMLKGMKGVDPDLIKSMVEADAQGEQRMMMTLMRSLQLGFSDIMEMPEIQNILRQLQVESALPQSPFGATSQGPGPIGGPGMGGAPVMTPGTGAPRGSAPSPGGRPRPQPQPQPQRRNPLAETLSR